MSTQAAPIPTEDAGRRMGSLGYVAILSITQLRRIVTDRGSVIWLFIFPFALAGVLGLSLQGLMSPQWVPNSPYTVAVVGGESPAYHGIVAALSGVKEYVHVVAADGEDEARRMVLHEETDGALLIPAGFPGEPLQFIGAPHRVSSEVLTEIIQSMVLRVGAQHLGSVSVEQTEVARTEVADRSDGLPSWLQGDAYQYYSIALTAMFALFAAHSAMVMSARDRQTDAYARLRTLGVRPATFFVSGAVAAWIMGFGFITVISVATRWVYGVDWGDLGGWFILTAVGSSTVAAVSFALTALIPSAEHVEDAGSTLFMIMAFLGGSMTPLQVLPKWLVTAFDWLPNRALLRGYLKLADGGDLAALSGDVGQLLLTTAVLVGLGTVVWTLRTRGERV